MQALHRISLRDNVCTTRVCEVLLTLTSTLIDLGVLANSTKALLTSLVKDDPTASAVIDKEVTAPENDTEKKDSSPAATAAETGTAKSPSSSSTTASVATFTLHNTFMDIVIR